MMLQPLLNTVCVGLFVITCICGVFSQEICLENQFQCTQGPCIANSKLCDGNIDCIDGSDENVDTCGNKICDITQYQCTYGGCIDINALCNGRNDCADSSDEMECPFVQQKTKCSLGRIPCLNGECIDAFQKCDGLTDCTDNSDEIFRTCGSLVCPSYAFRCSYGACVDAEAKCNGVKDCVDASDESESLCGKTFNITVQPTCSASQFKCKSGLCIDNNLICNGRRNCDDGTDETTALCKNNVCSAVDIQCSYGACMVVADFYQNPGICIEINDGQIFSHGEALPESTTTHRPPSDIESMTPSYYPTRPPMAYPSTPRPQTTYLPPTALGCVLPYQPIDGKYIIADGSVKQPEERVKEWTILQYTCDPNYQPNPESLIICLNNQWHKPIPICTAICPPLKSSSLDIKCTYNDAPVSCEDNVLSGTIAFLSCKESYEVDLIQPYNGITCLEGKWDNEIFNCTPTCGTPSPKGVTLIIGGSNVDDIADYPWHVGIYSKKCASKFLQIEQICGGTVITSNFILSAAHCFWDNNKKKLINPKKFYVGAGKFYRYWQHPKDNHAQHREVIDIKIPERYRALENSYANDIALVKLKEPLEMNSLVHPVCVDWNSALFKKHLRFGSKGTVVGWGVTEEGGNAAEKLHIATVPYVNVNVCQEAFPNYFRPFLTDDKFCAGYTNGTSVCVGDSGGGLTFQQNARYVVQGIVSVAPPKGSSCDSYTYSAYTTIYKHMDWIRSVELQNRV